MIIQFPSGKIAKWDEIESAMLGALDGAARQVIPVGYPRAWRIKDDARELIQNAIQSCREQEKRKVG